MFPSPPPHRPFLPHEIPFTIQGPPHLRNPNDLMWTSQGTFNNINRTCHHNSLTECISWNLCINSPRSLTRSTRECHGIASHEKNLSFRSLLPKYVLIRWFRRLIKLSGVELSHTIHHNNPYRRPQTAPQATNCTNYASHLLLPQSSSNSPADDYFCWLP